MSNHLDGLDPAIVATALERVRQPLDKARHLPGELYTSPAVLAREVQRIFRSDWLCVARVEELPRPGSYLATRVMNEPVLLTRDEDGAVNAFVNLCRHRGVQLVEDGAGDLGTARGMSCPYHGWSYDLKGCLTAAPLMNRSTGFSSKSIRLLTLRSDIWAGWIFITFDDQARPLHEFTAAVNKDIGFLQQERCRVGHKLVSIWNCNWKFVTENLCDPYHFRALHAKTFGPRIPVEHYNFDLRERGGSSAFYDASSQTPDGDAPLGPMPWLANHSREMSAFAFLAPNVALVGRIDEFHVYTVWPEAVDRTRVVLYHLFAADHFDRPDFDEKSRVYADFLAKVVEEDASVAPYLQQAALSRNFHPGQLAWPEKAVHHQMQYVVERTFA